MPNMTNDIILLDGVLIHKSKKLSVILAEHGRRLSKTQGVSKIINFSHSPQFNTLKLKIKHNNITTKKQLNKTLLRYFKQTNREGFENYCNHAYNNIKKAI